MTIGNNWVNITWDELKLRKGKLDYIGKSDDYSEIIAFKVDSSVVYYSKFFKEFSTESGSGCKDFYDNYKQMIDMITPEIDTGSLPSCHQSYFCGASDSSTPGAAGLSAGESLIFSLSSSDSSKSKIFQFNDDFYFVNGFFSSNCAPLGACADVEVLDYMDNVVGVFAKKVPILSDKTFNLENKNRGFISKYYKIRITVFNSNPSLCADHDAAETFKVVSCINIYRKNPYEQ